MTSTCFNEKIRLSNIFNCGQLFYNRISFLPDDGCNKRTDSHFIFRILCVLNEEHEHTLSFVNNAPTYFLTINLQIDSLHFRAQSRTQQQLIFSVFGCSWPSCQLQYVTNKSQKLLSIFTCSFYVNAPAPYTFEQTHLEIQWME